MKNMITLLAMLLTLPAIGSAEYIQVPGVVHVHSTYSSGRFSLPELVAMARLTGVEALVMTDHDWVVMEYGLVPLRRLLKIRKERPSVIKAGVDRYLHQINTLNDLQRDVIVIPGVQSSPFYYWTGNPVSGNLTAHDYRKELIAVGMYDINDYEQLPVLHRVSFSTCTGKNRIVCLVAVLMLGWGMWKNRPGKKNKLGMAVMGVSVLVLINFHPFYTSAYNPYHGNQDEAPFQDFIDYVRDRGGMTFWSHPESSYAASGRALGPVRLQTEPYPEMLAKTSGYNGFAAIYGDSAVAQNPGMQWDEVLYEYAAGVRNHPVWAIAEADFHGTRKGEALDRYQTVFLVKNKNRSEILGAMASGRMYAVLKQRAARPVLEDFKITDLAGGRAAFSGQELVCSGRFEISGRLSVSDGSTCRTEVLIIKNGRIIQKINEQAPFSFHFQSDEMNSGKTVYRIEARMKGTGKIISNPIFVLHPAGTESC